MKRLTLLAALLLLLAGCDSSASDEEDLAPGTMTARIDGERFEADIAFARPCAHCEVVDEGESIEVAGFGREGASIAIGILGFGGEGTYIFTHDELGAGAVVELPGRASFATDWEEGSGSIEVTRSAEDAIQGTFSFTTLDELGGEAVQVTEGRFNLPLCESYDDSDCFATVPSGAFPPRLHSTHPETTK